ncbi:MAG: hypothetical protein LRZ85_01570 [Alphaproteobacteria bacterium]|nr:hypothetical protein [Alphaproteobacteria bacterium]MCD8519746.1 hypothetical protein [Alphaproteobacteria bacterium]MCD8525783.1 hypothetical protein [Alphaproteobacteria bacterium]
MSLNDKFQKYVGLIIRDPQRITTDVDPIGDTLAQEGRNVGLLVRFTKASGNDQPFMADVNALHVFITKDGVPDDKKSWGWRIMDIRSDLD